MSFSKLLPPCLIVLVVWVAKNKIYKTNRHTYKRDRNGNCNSKAEKRWKNVRFWNLTPMNFAKHISKSNKRKLSNPQKGQARNYKTKCNCFLQKKTVRNRQNRLMVCNYKTFDGCYCTKKRRAKKLPTCETCIAQSFACVNTTYANTICSQLLLRKTAGKRQKFLQFLQQTDVRKNCPPAKLALRRVLPV